ncbi:MAG TPA: hypothetical protein VLT90_04650 [Terriglobales bacterium]|nr:hypothetical protein [Terriglobales bacterium]
MPVTRTMSGVIGITARAESVFDNQTDPDQPGIAFVVPGETIRVDVKNSRYEERARVDRKRIA